MKERLLELAEHLMGVQGGKLLAACPVTKEAVSHSGWAGKNGAKSMDVLRPFLEDGNLLGYVPASIGLSVLDADAPKGEEMDFEAVEALAKRTNALGWYKSVSGNGAHILYRFSEEAGNSKWGDEATGLFGDVRSAKGYLVFPGTQESIDVLTRVVTRVGGPSGTFPGELQTERTKKVRARKDGDKVKRTNGRTVQEFLDAYEKATGLALTKRQDQWEGPCPVCEGEDRFFVTEGDDGFASYHCRGGGDDAQTCPATHGDIMQKLFPTRSETFFLKVPVVNASVVRPIGKKEPKWHKLVMLVDEEAEKILQQKAKEAEATVGLEEQPEIHALRYNDADEEKGKVHKQFVGFASQKLGRKFVGAVELWIPQGCFWAKNQDGGRLLTEPKSGTTMAVVLQVEAWNYETEDGVRKQGTKLVLQGVKANDKAEQVLVPWRAVETRLNAVLSAHQVETGQNLVADVEV